MTEAERSTTFLDRSPTPHLSNRRRNKSTLYLMHHGLYQTAPNFYKTLLYKLQNSAFRIITHHYRPVYIGIIIDHHYRPVYRPSL